MFAFQIICNAMANVQFLVCFFLLARKRWQVFMRIIKNLMRVFILIRKKFFLDFRFGSKWQICQISRWLEEEAKAQNFCNDLI